jgi:hypothetical protein
MIIYFFSSKNNKKQHSKATFGLEKQLFLCFYTKKNNFKVTFYQKK